MWQKLALKELALAIIFFVFVLLSYGTFSVLSGNGTPLWEAGIAIAVEWLFYVGIVKFADVDSDMW